MSQSTFVESIESFKACVRDRLSADEVQTFEHATLRDLQVAILCIQETQVSGRTQRHLERLNSFLEAMEQYGRVVEVFASSQLLIAFVWGPMKFLLQTANTFADSFNALLEAYRQIGEHIPLLEQYQTLFHEIPHMRRVLRLLYEDILEFHSNALHYFKQRSTSCPVVKLCQDPDVFLAWKKLFRAGWKDYQTRFGNTLDRIQSHKSLLESQASLVQFAEFQSDRTHREAQYHALQEKEDLRRRNEIQMWLSAANTETNQERYAQDREEFPGTGQWLLKHDKFQDWFDSDICSTPLLWLSGIPGAGKSVLASLVVEEVRNLKSVNVAYFYCKHEDDERNSFNAMARALLSQLLKQHKDLVPYLHEEQCSSGEVTLQSSKLIAELLKTALLSLEKVYLVLDGLDECPRDEEKKIISWFRSIISGLPTKDQDCVRCLFISQEDDVTSKALSDVPHLKITPEDTMHDLKLFAAVWSSRIQEKFKLVDAERLKVAQDVAERASGKYIRVLYVVNVPLMLIKGMFLLAKLICRNLYYQTTRNKLFNEFKLLPRNLDEAYARIWQRISEDANQKEDAIKLLGWLVCARRPMNWLEIQGAISIDLEEQNVDPANRSLVADSKDICGSLVEIRSDGVVELVHTTAKSYLIDHEVIDPNIEQSQLANLCIGYMSFPCFESTLPDADLTDYFLRGVYVFFEYALAYWVAHLEASVAGYEDATPMTDSSETLGVFLELRLMRGFANQDIPVAMTRKWSAFQNHPLFREMLQILASVQRQTDSFDDGSASNECLALWPFLLRLRRLVESLPPRSLDESKAFYGSNLFKCSRINCVSFYQGFKSLQERNDHLRKHDRPYRCTFQACNMVLFGCSSKKELENHLWHYHGVTHFKSYDFPSQQIQPPVRDTATQQASEKSPKVVQESPLLAPAVKHAKTVRFLKHDCPECGKNFTRKHNLLAHSRSHTGDRPYKCEFCHRTFTRENDRSRHRLLHNRQKPYICCGIYLDNSGRSTRWGCGKSFVRGDAMKSHLRSGIGRFCTKELTDEERDDLILKPEACFLAEDGSSHTREPIDTPVLNQGYSESWTEVPTTSPWTMPQNSNQTNNLDLGFFDTSRSPHLNIAEHQDSSQREFTEHLDFMLRDVHMPDLVSHQDSDTWLGQGG